jgi:nitroreductase
VLDIFEAMNTQRAMRRLKPDPVPEELIWRLLDAAVKAPSGGNRQPWNFIVIRDAETRAKLAEYYLDGWNTTYGPMRQAAQTSPAIARTFNSADYLANHLAEVPVLIMATLDPSRVAPVTPPGANVFPAVQNLLLAARALGLGATLTTVYRTHEAEVKQLLGIPENVETMALVPIGYPEGKFGPVTRAPAEVVTYWEKWGETAQR